MIISYISCGTPNILSLVMQVPAIGVQFNGLRMLVVEAVVAEVSDSSDF